MCKLSRTHDLFIEMSKAKSPRKFEDGVFIISKEEKDMFIILKVGIAHSLAEDAMETSGMSCPVSSRERFTSLF